MFEVSGRYYDLIYREFKDYEREAETLRELILGVKPRGASLLDVACGTGEHHRYLAEHFEITGLDISEESIGIAREKNPGCDYVCGDMTEFELGKEFDVVMCLFSSIGYAKTLDRVKKSFGCFRNHMTETGLMLVEPWFTPETWRPGRLHMSTVDREDLKVCRMNLSEAQGRLSFFTFHYLIGTSEGVTHATERHELGLFTIDEMMEAFSASGIIAVYDEEGLSGRGLYTGKILK